MRSWRRILMHALAVTLCAVTVFVLLMAAVHYKRLESTYREENERLLQAWVQTTEARLSTVNEHFKALVMELYNDNIDISPEGEGLSVQQKARYLSFMQRELLINRDAGHFFIRDLAGETLVAESSRTIPFPQASKLRAWDKGNTLSFGTLNDGNWSVLEIEGAYWFYRAIPYGRYLVGVLSSLDNFPLEALIVKEQEAFCGCIAIGEVLYPVSGADWREQLRAADEGFAIDRRGVQLSTAGFTKVPDGTALLAARRFSLRDLLGITLLFLALGGGLIVALLLLLVGLLRHHVWQPTDRLLEAIRRVRDGELGHRIPPAAPNLEFYTVFDHFNEMVEQIKTLRIASYEQELERQQEELTLLRAQIRPHFYLNALTTVSNMTYENKGEEIRRYVAALARYMRYMLKLEEKKVTLGQEITHIGNYLDMQKLRFPDMVEAYIFIPPAMNEVQVPYLLLFTVVENIFKHGMDVYEKLVILIQAEPYRTEGFGGWRLTVCDNGKGFGEEILAQFAPGGQLPRAKEHFGLTNVSRTLRLTYRRDDLLRLSNTKPKGAQVEILIPAEKEGDTREDTAV